SVPRPPATSASRPARLAEASVVDVPVPGEITSPEGSGALLREVAGRERPGVAGVGQPAFSVGRFSSSLADIGPGELTEDEFWRVKDVLEELGEEAGRALEAMDARVRAAAA